MPSPCSHNCWGVSSEVSSSSVRVTIVDVLLVSVSKLSIPLLALGTSGLRLCLRLGNSGEHGGSLGYLLYVCEIDFTCLISAYCLMHFETGLFEPPFIPPLDCPWRLGLRLCTIGLLTWRLWYRLMPSMPKLVIRPSTKHSAFCVSFARGRGRFRRRKYTASTPISAKLTAAPTMVSFTGTVSWGIFTQVECLLLASSFSP